uniref:Ycf54 n=1 Tax=Mallomonas splendens TaxID=52552 RepID=A0A3G2QZQ7_9STRA|nr:ycf54 [Mallomonas splendens]AYO28607.1 ycf54 [Mallomonas splendens]
MKYYYIGLSQQDFFKNQVIEEVIRERVNHFISKKLQLNFWVVFSPLFLNNLEIKEKIKKTCFYKQKKQEIEFINNDYFAIMISTDPQYISWLKLRLGYFEDIELKDSHNFPENFKSDGFYGIYDLKDIGQVSPFEINKNLVHPLILIEKYKKSLELSLLT